MRYFPGFSSVNLQTVLQILSLLFYFQISASLKAVLNRTSHKNNLTIILIILTHCAIFAPPENLWFSDVFRGIEIELEITKAKMGSTIHNKISI